MDEGLGKRWARAKVNDGVRARVKNGVRATVKI
jgi:hypothetical protein